MKYSVIPLILIPGILTVTGELHSAPRNDFRPLKDFNLKKDNWRLTYSTGSYSPPGNEWVPVVYELTDQEQIRQFAANFILSPTGGEFGTLNGSLSLFRNGVLAYSITAEVNPNGFIAFSHPTFGGMQEPPPYLFSTLFKQFKRVK